MFDKILHVDLSRILSLFSIEGYILLQREWSYAGLNYSYDKPEEIARLY
jgi:hypothetical protein